MTAFLIHPKLPTGIKAAIFDADGVLLNTAGIWKGLGDRYLKSLGLVPEEGLGTRLFSMSLEQGADYLRTRYALGNTAEEIIADLETLLHDFYYYEAEAKPGARELAALLADSGVALAVATSSPKDLICSALSRLGLLSYFQQVLTTTEIKESKHRPKIFLAAAENLGARPCETLVFEDSLYALKTAAGAGFITVGIFDPDGEEDQQGLQTDADLYLRSLCDLFPFHPEHYPEGDTMKPSQRLYRDMIAYWEKNNTHPFVQGMADGTLPKECFQFYITQDHLYLMQYAKVFAMGVIKARNEEDQRLFAGLISATLDVENAIHKTYLQRLGLTNEQLAAAKPSIVTESYTNYMISIAQKEGLASIMAAVLACSWTYKLIGDYMETFPGAKEQPFYGLWINQYMGEEYRNANDLMIDMFDRYADGCTDEEYDHLKHIVYLCTQYEYMFWDMGWNMKMEEEIL